MSACAEELRGVRQDELHPAVRARPQRDRAQGVPEWRVKICSGAGLGGPWKVFERLRVNRIQGQAPLLSNDIA